MNFRTTYILFGVLFGLLGVFLLTQLKKKPVAEMGYVLPSLHEPNVKTKDIDTVVLDRRLPKEEKLVFVRTEQGWRLEKPDVRADGTAVDQLIDQVFRVSKEEKAVDLTSNLKQFGLEPPSAIITLKKGADTNWTLNLGDESAGGKENALVYVASSDAPKEVMAVRRAQIDYLFKPVNELRARDLLSEGVINFPEAVTRVQLQAENAQPVVLDKTDKGRWRFEKPPLGEADEGGDFATTPGREESRQTGVRGLLTEIAGLRVDADADFVADDVTDLAKYGLEDRKPVWLRVDIKRKPSGFGADSDKDKAVESSLLVGKPVDDKNEKRYARLGGERAVVALPVKKLLPIVEDATKPDTLRNRDLVHLDAAKTDAINIQNAEGLIELRRTGTPDTWRLYQGKTVVADADFGAVQDLMKDLNTKRQVKEFPDPAKSADYGFDKPTAGVSLWVEGIQKDEKQDDKKEAEGPKLKTDKPTIKLTFGKKDKGVVYVSREVDNEKTIVTVPDALLTRIGQGPLAYRDRNLPSFSENADVVKLSVTRGNETFVLEKEKKDDKSPSQWKLKEPKDLAGKAADNKNADKIIAELRRLRPEKLVADKAADLDKFGLKQPHAKATVTLKKDDKKTEDWVYLFGKEGDGGLYAKLGDRDLVFVAAPQNVESILRGELQDPTVFHFDPNKVQEVKLSGWKNQGIGTIVLDLARAAGKGWTVKTPPDFNLDTDQADAFVKSLSELWAIRFVSRSVEPKPAYKLDPKERLLYVEVTLEGEKTPLTLTLGDFDSKEKGYYATSSTLPRDVFLVPQVRFETILTSGPKYFSKGAEKK
jgi:Domain of unknown function (DUF4340)